MLPQKEYHQVSRMRQEQWWNYVTRRGRDEKLRRVKDDSDGDGWEVRTEVEERGRETFRTTRKSRKLVSLTSLFTTFNDASTTLNAKFRRETLNDCSRETTLRNARHRIKAWRRRRLTESRGFTIRIPVGKHRVSLVSKSKTRTKLL